MTFTRAIVAGAGLAGLSAATALVEAGVAVRLVDGAAQAGGRCRSYHDPQLGLTIDNGNHLVLAGNGAVARFRERVGADAATLAGPAHADFVFADLGSGERWTVRINDGRVPWWIAARSRRVPGTRAGDYLRYAPLATGGEGRIDARVPTRGAVWERLLDPVLLAVLNTAPAEGSAALAGAVLRETLGRGGRAMRPLVAEPSLAAAFIDPAVSWLAQLGAAPTLGRRLRAIGFDDERVATLDWGSGPEAVAEDEAVVLALPAWVAASLIPGLVVPDEHRAIVNAHFAVAPPAGAPPMLGLLGATAEWLFAFPDRISVTVSAADRLADRDREELARAFWDDIRRAYGIDMPMPRWQVVKEKRATFAATPAQNARRPAARTRWRNLFLAGDWTQTGLPSTIEGALRSGETAAVLVTGG
jgi:squalene-associated FAD-dependent desaturase